MIQKNIPIPANITEDDLFSSSIFTYRVLEVAGDKCIVLSSARAFVVLDTNYLKNYCVYLGKAKYKFGEMFS